MNTNSITAQQLELKAQQIQNKYDTLQVAVAVDGSGDHVVSKY